MYQKVHNPGVYELVPKRLRKSWSFFHTSTIFLIFFLKPLVLGWLVPDSVR